MFSKATRIVVAVVGAALLVGLLAVGTVTVAGPPGPPPKPPKPEPTPRLTPDQIIDGVNRLLPLALTPKNRLPLIDAARSIDDGSFLISCKADKPAMLVFPREVRLFAARSIDDGLLFGRRAGATPLGAIELGRDYKLGVKTPPEMITIAKGRYGIAAVYDKENKIDAEEDPKNEIDFWLVLVGEDADGDGLVEIVAFIGLPHRELARVMGMVDPQLQIEFAQGVSLNLVAALLQ